MAELKGGLSPEKAALAVALGAWLGIIPALGTTTLLCVAVGWPLRLNQALLLAVNYLVYPLQLALLFPFYGWGSRVFGGPVLGLGMRVWMQRFRDAPWDLLRQTWWVGVHACVVWAGLGLLVVPPLWWILNRIFRGMALPARTQAEDGPL